MSKPHNPTGVLDRHLIAKTSPRADTRLDTLVRYRKGRRREGTLALGGYLLLAVLFLGRHAVPDPTGGTLGQGPDVQTFLWGLRWWPHALEHGLNPLVTRLVWPPGGVDVLWTTTVPLLSILMAPITLTLGVAASWNILCILAPALSAWTTWLLCRQLGAQRQPAALGGALFGFSSFEIAQGTAHLQLSMSALIPFAAYTAARYVKGEVSDWGLVSRLAAITSLQFLISPELLETAVMIGTAGATAAVVLIADRRALILRTARLAALGLMVGCAPLIPLLVSMLTHRPAHTSAQASYSADLLNLVIPTPVTAVGGTWATQISRHYPGNIAERCAYLGIPIVVIIVGYAIRRRHSSTARAVGVLLAVSVLCSLGPRLTIDGHATILLPWSLISHVSVVSDALPVRFALYTALISAVVAAVCLSEVKRAQRWMLTIVAGIFLIPGSAGVHWGPTPAAISSPELNAVLEHQRVLSLPFFDVGDHGLYAQAADDMRFSVIDNWMQLRPHSFDRYNELRWPVLISSGLANLQGPRVWPFEQQLCEAHITRLLVWTDDPHLLAGLKLEPRLIGDALVYNVSFCRRSALTLPTAKSRARSGSGRPTWSVAR